MKKQNKNLIIRNKRGNIEPPNTKDCCLCPDKYIQNWESALVWCFGVLRAQVGVFLKDDNMRSGFIIQLRRSILIMTGEPQEDFLKERDMVQVTLKPNAEEGSGSTVLQKFLLVRILELYRRKKCGESEESSDLCSYESERYATIRTGY